MTLQSLSQSHPHQGLTSQDKRCRAGRPGPLGHRNTAGKVWQHLFLHHCLLGYRLGAKHVLFSLPVYKRPLSTLQSVIMPESEVQSSRAHLCVLTRLGAHHRNSERREHGVQGILEYLVVRRMGCIDGHSPLLMPLGYTTCDLWSSKSRFLLSQQEGKRDVPGTFLLDFLSWRDVEGGVRECGTLTTRETK